MPSNKKESKAYLAGFEDGLVWDLSTPLKPKETYEYRYYAVAAIERSLPEFCEKCGVPLNGKGTPLQPEFANALLEYDRGCRVGVFKQLGKTEPKNEGISEILSRLTQVG